MITSRRQSFLLFLSRITRSPLFLSCLFGRWISHWGNRERKICVLFTINLIIQQIFGPLSSIIMEFALPCLKCYLAQLFCAFKHLLCSYFIIAKHYSADSYSNNNNYKSYKTIRQMMDTSDADLQFFLMKIARLQSDLANTQNQLLNARLRLRTAQDFQIKYELLLKQSEQDSQRHRLLEMEEEEKVAELISLKLKQRDQFWSDKLAKLEKDQAERYTRELTKIGDDFSAFRKKHERCGNKFDEQDILSFKNKKLLKEVEVLQQKIDQMKREHERSKQDQIKQIKDSLQIKNKEKQDGERKIYRQKIQSLESNIERLESELMEAKSKADPKRESEIERLKRELNLQLERNNEQLDKINKGFTQKYASIQNTLSERYKIEEALMSEKKQLKQYIKDIENKLFDKEKEHEIELIHLKERMARIREEEAENFKIQISKIEERYHQQRDSWSVVLRDKDSEIERITNKHADDTQRHKDDRAKQLQKIESLKEKLKEYEQAKQGGQTENLLKSMKEISAKEEDFANYENGVTFLDRQLKKALSKVEQKNIEINKIIKQLNECRKQSEDEINELKEKARKDKKYYMDKISQLEHEVRELHDEARNKDREHKRKQKDLQSKITQISKQNTSLKDLVDEVQKDYARALQNKKAVQASYREQREKGMTSKSDLTMVKKQKWLEIEKQKNQLEVIYKQKQEQLKSRHQIQMEKLRHERDQLRTQVEKYKGMFDAQKNESGDNKENRQSALTEYHKKVSTLNLQIALTKNIYNALVEAKARKPRDSKVSEFDKIEQNASESDHREQKDERQPPFMNHSDLQKMTISFNPKQK